ncbi:MAG: thymidylate synthase [Candidatus Diapherotrites archaeon CG11_big_fil_rev_8_21_14_0_20_37_9]|nr:MAG: thymidylate synthase [Candidatus Diapherotrites archaeon CG11_big_fil_rev_8_21_14_0_20_37_9]
MDKFTNEEAEILKPFFSNLDKDIFVLVNLPEVVKGALFSRYSRTAKSIRRLLLDEFINDEKMGFKEIVAFSEKMGYDQVVATQKAEEFYDRVLVGYGDDSVAELGGAHIACENVSNIVSKILEDSRIGISPLEKSTRYVYFDKKIEGEYLYVREPGIMESKYADEYIETCDSLFDSYSRLIEPTKKWLMEKFPQDSETSDRAYGSTIRAKACDILRGFLPASTKTNVGLFGNGRSLEFLIIKMHSSELAEARDVAKEMQTELMKVMPSFVKRATGKYGDPTINFLAKTKIGMGTLSEKLFSGENSPFSEEVTLTDYDKDAENKVIAAALYPFTDVSFETIKKKVKAMDKEEKIAVINEYIGKRENRRHKPGRGFEHTFYEFDLACNYASYRDLHRHRVLTQQRQDLGTTLGFDLPPEMKELGIDKEFSEKMLLAKKTNEKIKSEMPKQSQYVVPFAYRIRWSNYLNLRELYHLVELRSTIHGHPDYRRIVLKMFDEVNKVHPRLVEHMKFIDRREIGLERLESEKKIDKKIEQVKKKYGE